MNAIDEHDDAPPVRLYGMPDPQNRQPEPIQGMRGENAGSRDEAPEMRRRVTTSEGRSFDVVETSGRAAGEAVEARRRMKEPSATEAPSGSSLSSLFIAFGAGLGLAAIFDSALVGVARPR